jgi:site-specific recombinase XerD
MASSPKLLDQVTIVARLKHLSLRTEKAYRQHIKQFILFHNKRHPIEMGETEIRDFLSHLAIDRNVAASTQNVALAALLFLYKETLTSLTTRSTFAAAKAIKTESLCSQPVSKSPYENSC